MNKLISTNERVFISLVGPSGSGKSHLIFDWLEIGTFGPGHKFVRNGSNISFWRSQWIRKVLYGLFFCKL